MDIASYFHTDWSAFTTNDWVGLISSVVVFILMAIAYFYTFRPKNRKHLEKQRFIPLDED